MKKILGCLGNVKQGVAVLAAGIFIRIVYAPLELFFINRDEFWFDMYLMFPFLLGTFVVLLLAGTLVLLLLKRLSALVYHIGVSLLFVYFIGTYVQGNFLVSNLPSLDGTVIDWGSFTVENIITSVVYLALVVAAVVATRFLKKEKLQKIYALVTGCMCLMLLITLVTVCITNEGYRESNKVMTSNKDEYQFSTRQNLVVFVLDRLDGSYVREALEKNSEYSELLSDFTFYEDTVGGYPYTKYSIPLILSGQWYENDVSSKEYFNQFLENSVIINKLKKNNYKIQIYEEDLTITYNIDAEKLSASGIDNVIDGRMRYSSAIGFEKMLIKLGGIKFAPYIAKEKCYNYSKGVSAIKPSEFYEYDVFTSENERFYNENYNVSTSYTDEGVFKFIHIFGAHGDYTVDSDGSTLPDDRLGEASYEKSVEACFSYMRMLIERMKKAGVYDNSAIVLMSDHGMLDAGVTMAQTPTLIVKGIGEKHEFRVSDAPISYDDLQDAFVNLLDGKCADEVFSASEGDERSRRFIWYTTKTDSYMEEFEQTGKSWNLKTMLSTGNVYRK